MLHPFITESGRRGTPAPQASRAGAVSAPVWLRVAMLLAAAWIGIALVHGITTALTHAAHGL